MSRCGVGALLLCGSLVAAAPLAAQDSLAMLRRMEARLDSLRSVARAAARRGADTVVVGRFHIATSAALHSTVEAAARDAQGVLRSRFGARAVDSGFPLILLYGTAVATAPVEMDSHEVARNLERSASQLIWQSQDSVLIEWFGGAFPVEPLAESELSMVSFRMAALPALPSRACLGGDAGACGIALGLGLGADTIESWYAPAAWPGLAERIRLPLQGPDLRLRDRCAEEQDMTACRAVLTPPRIPAPVGAHGRSYLVQVALDLGGADAFARLTADPTAPMERRLAAAAETPLPRLLQQWSDSVVGAMPPGPSSGFGQALLALACSAILLALSLGGSRWR